MMWGYGSGLHHLPAGDAVPMEQTSGTNVSTYFVCNYLGGPLTRLPNAKPQHIKAARQLKRYFTGKLSSPVATYPPFPGKEAEYLRAQVRLCMGNL